MTGGKNSGIIGLRNWQQHDYYNGVDLHPLENWRRFTTLLSRKIYLIIKIFWMILLKKFLSIMTRHTTEAVPKKWNFFHVRALHDLDILRL
jgi:hypothetical protein